MHRSARWGIYPCTRSAVVTVARCESVDREDRGLIPACGQEVTDDKSDMRCEGFIDR